MKGAVLICLLLALVACDRAPPPNDATAPTAPSQAPTVGSPSSDPEPDGSAPRNSFIVCPGNPRCPPADGSQPKGRQ